MINNANIPRFPLRWLSLWAITFFMMTQLIGSAWYDKGDSDAAIF